MLAVASGKGGSGKTTAALGLARALVKRGRDPVVVDCDADMPDLHHYAGVEHTAGVDDVAAGGRLRDATLTTPTVPGVRLLTAGDRDSVPPALRRAREWHGPVIADCPPGVGPDAAGPLRIADTAALFATDQPQSLEDAATTAKMARRLGATPLGVVVRTTGAPASERWTDQSPVLAEVPTVEKPLASPQVSAHWRDLSELILRNCERAAERGSKRGKRGARPDRIR